MEPVTSKPPLTPDEMNIPQRLMADAPKFWKIIGLVAGALMIVAGAALNYHLCPPAVPATVGMIASVAWALHNLAAKNPMTSETFTPAGLLAYFNQSIQVAQQTWAQGFKPEMAPPVAVEVNELKEIEKLGPVISFEQAEQQDREQSQQQ